MHRPRLLALLALLALAAAGPLACGPLDGDGLDAELEPIDEEGFLLNDPEQERHTTAACPSGGNVTPATPSFGSSIDGYTSYVGQSSCSGSSKPGVTAFKDLVLATYPCTSSGGIVRGCSVGGKSEHKEGRAWDWMIQVGHPAAAALLGWLLKTDAHGNPHAMARRLGIMYIVWNKQMWRAYKASSGWLPYTGSNPHTDHVHFSFSWDGAKKQTSFWTAPQTCTPKCDGTKIVGADCGVGDCGVYGALCVDDSLGVRCVFSMCPAQGTKQICVNATTLGACADDALTQTDCSATGASCVAAGGTASCKTPPADLGLVPDAGSVAPDADTPSADGGYLPVFPDAGGAGASNLTGGCAVGRGQGTSALPLLLALAALIVLGARRRGRRRS